MGKAWCLVPFQPLSKLQVGLYVAFWQKYFRAQRGREARERRGVIQNGNLVPNCTPHCIEVGKRPARSAPANDVIAKLRNRSFCMVPRLLSAPWVMRQESQCLQEIMPAASSAAGSLTVNHWGAVPKSGASSLCSQVGPMHLSARASSETPAVAIRWIGCLAGPVFVPPRQALLQKPAKDGGANNPQNKVLE